jgi:hypothetical protein
MYTTPCLCIASSTKFKFKRSVIYSTRPGVNLSKHGITDNTEENEFNIRYGKIPIIIIISCD